MSDSPSPEAFPDKPADPGSALADVAVESWRFTRVCAKVLGKLEATEAGRYASQLRYFQRRLDDSLARGGLRLVNVEGQAFDTGMAATALNIGDFGPDDQLEVDQMLEPILMGPDGLQRSGTVLLRKAKP